LWAERANAVRGAFLHAYHGYELYGLPHDELRPLSNRSKDMCVPIMPYYLAC
jgi:mannosyl-oligosaccharide alpha-1,2-mannosidase